MTSRWSDDAGRRGRRARRARPGSKAEFYLRQIAAALSPVELRLHQPGAPPRDAHRRTARTSCAGMEMLAEDLKAGRGELKIRQSDRSGFELGKNTGDHARQGRLPRTSSASSSSMRRRPRRCCDGRCSSCRRGSTSSTSSTSRRRNPSSAGRSSRASRCSCVSWVNPDSATRGKSFGTTCARASSPALDAIEAATGEREVNAIGYCVGGTLLAATLAYMAANGDERIASATFFATQVDFTHAGDLKVFVDAEQIDGARGADGARAAISTARGWRTPSTCCGRTT